jgi:hypothetical protein
LESGQKEITNRLFVIAPNYEYFPTCKRDDCSQLLTSVDLSIRDPVLLVDEIVTSRRCGHRKKVNIATARVHLDMTLMGIVSLTVGLLTIWIATRHLSTLTLSRVMLHLRYRPLHICLDTERTIREDRRHARMWRLSGGADAVGIF